jgi:hypothetical protein
MCHEKFSWKDIQLCTFDLLDGGHSPLSPGLHPRVLVGPCPALYSTSEKRPLIQLSQLIRNSSDDHGHSFAHYLACHQAKDLTIRNVRVFNVNIHFHDNDDDDG